MFSGAVRAVFRKKKGFGFVKILHWLLLVLFSAAAALARLRLLAVGFDADGLPVPMDLNTMVLPAVFVVAAVIAVIMARRYPAQRELCGSMDLYFAFDRSTLAVLLMVLGSFALIGSAVCSLVFSLRTTLTMILSVFLAVGAACLLYATTALRRKAEFSGVALLVPVCAMVLALILFYREHATDPILRHYYVETLALAALTVLLTGLVNPQVVRTADMMDMVCVVFVRGKEPSAEMVELAEDRGIALLKTPLRMFTACGLLYESGLHGGDDVRR